MGREVEMMRSGVDQIGWTERGLGERADDAGGCGQQQSRARTGKGERASNGEDDDADDRNR
jgi:hypothetical protein